MDQPDLTTPPTRIRWRRLAWSLLGGVVAVTVLVGGYAAYLWMVVSLPAGEDRPPLRIYGSSFVLEAGLHLAEAHLTERLERLGYRAVAQEVREPGDYRITPETVELYLHHDPTGSSRAHAIKLILEDNRVAGVVSLADGEPVFPVALEPALLGGMRGASRQVRDWVSLSEIPRTLVSAVLAIEDRRFYQHGGVDPWAVARALWANVRTGQVVQGGSTITQQLAKNLFYSRERTASRKIKEALTALVLEMKYRKDAILECYLNEIYLGQVESVSIYGVAEAARWYFGKPVAELTDAEAALLAAMIKGPNLYSPFKDPSLARARRDLALSLLREDGTLDPTAWEAAIREPLPDLPSQESASDAPYFVDYLLRQEGDDPGDAFPPGSKVVTTLDPILQRLAEDSVIDGLQRLESARPRLTRPEAPLQAALVALDPSTGAILAMVGGRDYKRSQFNRAVQARRQPGSLFKPLVYLAAFEAGRAGDTAPFTPGSLVQDEPVSFPAGQTTWSPRNYDGQYRGPVTVRVALEHSLNVPAVRVAHTVGVQRIVALAGQLGLRVSREPDLSFALGTAEVSLLEMTAAFGALANHGLYLSPSAVQSVLTSHGDSLWRDIPERRQAVSAGTAYLVTSLMEGVIERGTGTLIRRQGLTTPLAGKTGTTDGNRDAWFIGYTPELAIGVWVGFDDGRDLGLTGAEAALPIWIDFARQVLPSNSPPFPVPAGIVTRELDPQTGQLATSKCPQVIEEVFVEGTEPTEYCALHGVGVWDRVKRWFHF